MNITKSIKVNCTKEELWPWLIEFEKIQKWNTTILKEELISTGKTEKGLTSKILIREGKRDIWYNNEILEYEPGKLLSIKLSGGSLGKHPMVVDYEIHEKEDQLEVVLKSHWKPSGIMLYLFYPLIKIKSVKNTEEVLKALKQQIEK